MGPWVMCRRLNLQESRWQNSWENHLMIDPKTGYTSINDKTRIITGPVFGGQVIEANTMEKSIRFFRY